MYFTESGSGKIILLVHGFCETSEIWSELQVELSKSYRVISIDLPGCGNSKLYQESGTLQDIARLIFDFLNEQNITECFMIGHSLGGYIALAFANNYMDKLTGFGLFHSTTFADGVEKKEVREKGIDHVRGHGMNSFVKGFVPNLFFKGNQNKYKEAIDEVKRIASQTSLKTFTFYGRAMKNRQDLTSLLSSFSKPVFIIAGENDTAVPPEQSAKMIEKLNSGDAIILPETGHMGFIEKRKESFEFIKSFLSKNLI